MYFWFSGFHEIEHKKEDGLMKSILFIQPAFELGGIETFLIRLSTRLNANGVKVGFLILHEDKINLDLLSQLKESATVYYWKDFVYGAALKHKIIKFLLPIKTRKVKNLLKDFSHIHIVNSLSYFCAERLVGNIPSFEPKCVFGIYHANELAWSISGEIPKYEKFFRNKIIKNNLSFIFFNEYSKKVFFEKNGNPEVHYSMFPLGIDLPKWDPAKKISFDNKKLNIVSVGRLVEFKSYNIYFLDSVKKLVNQGIDLQYTIYGSGPLKTKIQEKIHKLSLENYVFLKGNIEYRKLDDYLSQYNLFLGSGTSLLQAAANGLICITAIENEKSENSYGFFSDIEGLDYHEQGLEKEKINFPDLLYKFNQMTVEEKNYLSYAHMQKSQIFSMSSYVDNFMQSFAPFGTFKGNKYNFYIFSVYFVISEAFARIVGGFSYKNKYESKL